MRLIDVEHLGRERVIGCWEVDGALIDPGPQSSMETLLAKLGGERPEAVLLTHIHLDHAAATGALVERWPDIVVYVHERGAPHMEDPSRLLASAGRLYGDRMEELWGRIVPIPAQNIRALKGGEVVRGMEVAYTPGHASHHVSYLHRDTGTAFVGDVAGCRIPPSDLVLAPTPPPDVDIEAWEASLDGIEAWNPSRLVPTHFGVVDEPAAHLETLRERLRAEAATAKEMDKAAYTIDLERRIRAQLADEGQEEDTIEELMQAAPLENQWGGLDRYWRKRSEREGGEDPPRPAT